MQINSWISTRTHCFSTNVSVSLIYNAKSKVYYLLKGVSSRLWNFIADYQDYYKVLLFAKNNNMEKELHSLLFELKEKEIINSEEIFIKSIPDYYINAISIESKNYKYFYSMWIRYLYSNNCINTLYLELNYKCNLKCKHCYNHKNMDEYYISLDWAKKAIDQAYNLGISVVKITGGECTINENFFEIAKYVRSKLLELYIITNGQVLYDNDKLMNNLLSLYPAEIRVSLYSMNPQIHDGITGVNGSWQKTINIIKKLKAMDINVTVSTPILSYNIDSYKEILKFSEKTGVKAGHDCLFIHNPENNNLSSKLSYDEIKQYYIEKFAQTGFVERDKFEKTDMPVCGAGWDRLCITPDLNVLPCVGMDYILGNLMSASLKDIHNTTIADFKKIFVRKNLTECFNDEYCRYCVYCSDTACFNNTFMKKQPILCENARAYYNAVLYHKNKGQKYEKYSKV